MNLDAHIQSAAGLVMDLLALPGKSCEESQVAEFVRQRLQQAGADESATVHDTAHQRTPQPGEVGNLIFQLPGTRPGPRRLLSAHLDTVPLCAGARPQLEGRRIKPADSHTALGADNRAGCAAILNAALEILKNDLPHPPLTFCWFVQEEIGLQGARCLDVELLGEPKLAFNWDGGIATNLVVGATGGYRMDIDVLGLASHAGAAPNLGVSAIAIASLAVADLHRQGWHGLIEKDGRYGTSNVGGFHGGDATNVVAEKVSLIAEARSHDPEFRREIVQAIEAAFENAAKEVVSGAGAVGSVRFQGRLDYESFKIPDDAPSVRAARRAAQTVGREPQLAIANGGLDANWLAKHGIPAVSLGCGQMNQHTVQEMLDLDEFEDACRIALLLATEETDS